MNGYLKFYNPDYCYSAYYTDFTHLHSEFWNANLNHNILNETDARVNLFPG